MDTWSAGAERARAISRSMPQRRTRHRATRRLAGGSATDAGAIVIDLITDDEEEPPTAVDTAADTTTEGPLASRRTRRGEALDPLTGQYVMAWRSDCERYESGLVVDTHVWHDTYEAQVLFKDGRKFWSPDFKSPGELPPDSSASAVDSSKTLGFTPFPIVVDPKYLSPCSDGSSSGGGSSSNQRSHSPQPLPTATPRTNKRSHLTTPAPRWRACRRFKLAPPTPVTTRAKPIFQRGLGRTVTRSSGQQPSCSWQPSSTSWLNMEFEISNPYVHPSLRLTHRISEA